MQQHYTYTALCTYTYIITSSPSIIGSVSSSDSGHGSYAQQHDTSSSVYTAADCRLLQQISNTAARNLSGSGGAGSSSSNSSSGSNSSTPTTPIPPPPPYHMLRSAAHNAANSMYHANATSAAPLPPPPYPRLHCGETMVAPLMHPAHTRHSNMHGKSTHVSGCKWVQSERTEQKKKQCNKFMCWQAMVKTTQQQYVSKQVSKSSQ